MGQTEFNTVINVKYYGHMTRVINTAAIYEEKNTHKTHDTHTQIKLEGWGSLFPKFWSPLYTTQMNKKQIAFYEYSLRNFV